MDIKILGSGCRNCQTLEASTIRALDDLGIEAAIDHVRDPADIASYGVMSTPALLIDDEIVILGRVPPPDQVRSAIEAAIADA